jgi:hypothetical protein
MAAWATSGALWIQEHKINPQENVHPRVLILNMATLRSTIIDVHFNDSILVNSTCSPST